jgi:thiamine-phosphate pyrophosphorylase
MGGPTRRQADRTAAVSGAVYFLFGGPGVAPAATVDRAAWAAELFELPCVAFAGEMSEIAPLVAAGADFIALDFVWRDPRGAAAGIAEAASHLRLPEPVS